MRLEEAITGRRSLRRFESGAPPDDIIRDLVRLACAAPAPHHSRPWRFVHVSSSEGRRRLTNAMADAWRADLERDSRPAAEIERLLARSRRQLAAAPSLLLACLCLLDARPWPDERRRAERDMFVQSLGAALQNLLLAAHGRGLAAYLKGAPLFCSPSIAAALNLPEGWEPAFLVLLGRPAKGAEMPPRPEMRMDDFLLAR